MYKMKITGKEVETRLRRTSHHAWFEKLEKGLEKKTKECVRGINKTWFLGLRMELVFTAV